MSNPSVLPEKATVADAHRNRRIAVRHASNPDAECIASVPPGSTYSAWVRDISASGISLLAPREFAVGTDLTLLLENVPRGVLRLLRARVVHALEVPPNGHWLHGCSFDRPLSERELQAFAEIV